MAGRAVKFIAEQQIKEEIRNFKRLMETGELPTTEGQPSGRSKDSRHDMQRERMQVERADPSSMRKDTMQIRNMRQETMQ
jgi:hypothetical protein